MFSGPFLNKRVSQAHKGFLFGNSAHLQEALFLEVRMTLRTVWQSVIKVMWQKAPKTSRENEGGGPVSAGRDYLLPKENKSQPRSQRKAPITRGQEFSVKKDHKSIPQHELGHFVSRLLFFSSIYIVNIKSCCINSHVSFISYHLSSLTEKNRKHLMSSSKSGASE